MSEKNNDDHLKGPAPYHGAKKIQKFFASAGKKRDPEQVKAEAAKREAQQTTEKGPAPYHGASKIKKLLAKK